MRACVWLMILGCGGGSAVDSDLDGDDDDAADVDTDVDADADADTDVDSDTDTDTDLETPPDGIHAAFHIVDSMNDLDVLWEQSAGNLVQCQFFPNYGNYLWVRLAVQTASDGNYDTHVDIDICNYGGTGTHAEHNPMGQQCNGPTFGFWWHPTPNLSWVNAQTGCTLELTDNGSDLTGTISSCPLTQQPGTAPGEVTDLTFRCVVENG